MMHSIILFLVFGIGFEAIADPNLQSIASVLEDVDDYDNSEGTIPYQKRFWSPLTSDYNPLRRPVPVPGGSKRDDGVVNHPVPRVVTMKQLRNMGHSQEDEYPETFEILDGGRQKKQTRPTTLIFRLGSKGLRRGRKADKTVAESLLSSIAV